MYFRLQILLLYVLFNEYTGEQNKCVQKNILQI